MPVELEVPSPTPVRVARPVLLERQSLVEKVRPRRVEVPLCKPVARTLDRPTTVQRRVERLRPVERPTRLAIRKQVGHAQRRAVTVEQVRTVQPMVNVPVVTEEPKDLVTQVSRASPTRYGRMESSRC